MDRPSSDRSYVLAGLGDDLDARAKPRPGNPQAAPATLDLTLIFRDHHAQLVRIALLLVGDRPTAEDVVQDVFARLCAPGRRLEPATGLAYIRAAVVNGCRSVQRRRILTRRLEGARDALRRDSQESAEYTAILAEDRRQVLAALAALPHRRREVLVLRFYLNLTVAEVATMLGISQGTVKSTAARGLEALGRRLPRWVAPVAAAAAVALVIGSVAALSGREPGPGRPAASSVTAPHRFYVESALGDVTVVRSTATGAVTATLPIPYRDADPPVVAAGPRGAFYVAAFVRGAWGERIYRFRLTSTGHVSGFAPLPGGLLDAGQMADSMAVSPGGSLLAFGLAATYGHNPPADQLVVINTVTGAKTTWRGGVVRPGFKWLKIASLSWTGDGKKLVVLGQWTRTDSGFYSETGAAGRIAEVREIDLASGGGRVSGGRLLLRQSAQFPYIGQALISPDGSTITALVLKGGIVGSKQIGGIYPENMSVEQISAATGRKLSVLYRRSLGDTGEINGAPDPLALSTDATGRNLMLTIGACNLHCSNGRNGWIHGGRLIPLQPADGSLASEAW